MPALKPHEVVIEQILNWMQEVDPEFSGAIRASLKKSRLLLVDQGTPSGSRSPSEVPGKGELVLVLDRVTFETSSPRRQAVLYLGKLFSQLGWIQLEKRQLRGVILGNLEGNGTYIDVILPSDIPEVDARLAARNIDLDQMLKDPSVQADFALIFINEVLRECESGEVPSESTYGRLVSRYGVRPEKAIRDRRE